MSYSSLRYLCGDGQSHGGVSELGACADTDVERTGGEPGDDRAAEPATAAALDNCAAPSSTTAAAASATESCK